MRRFLIVAVVAVGSILGGCSTPSPNALAANDPYEATNREIFKLNLKIDRLALRPTATAYSHYVPVVVRDSVHNVLVNLDLPVTFTNDVLQGERVRAGQTFTRFMVNSTLGLGGLIDVTNKMGVPEHTEDFGQTLAVWGFGDGPYLMLPLLGPSSPRDATGRVVDVFMDPTVYVRIKQHTWWMLGREYFEILDARARNMETLDDIERNSLDFYAATRSLYRQYRANEIRNGRAPQETNPPATNLP